MVLPSCVLCGLSFPDGPSAHLDHRINVHLLSEVEVQCLICDMRFSRRDDAVQHVKHIHQIGAAAAAETRTPPSQDADVKGKVLPNFNSGSTFLTLKQNLETIQGLREV